MEYGPLGTAPLVVSRLGMGCGKLGSGNVGQRQRSAARLVEQAVDAGITLFDTADAYGSGRSESILGEVLRGRHDVVIATKVGYVFSERSALHQAARTTAASLLRRMSRRTGSSPAAGLGGRSYAAQDFGAEHIRRAVAGSLRRLHRSRIDLLQFHGPPLPDSCELPAVIADLIAVGDVRCFGVGAETLEQASAWLDVPGLTSLQLPFGVLDPQAADTIIPTARQRGVAVIARGVLGGGLLGADARGEQIDLDPRRRQHVTELRHLASEHAVDVLQLAVWYALHRVPVDAILIGMSNAQQLARSTAFVDTTPPAGIVDAIRGIVERDGGDGG